MLALVVQLNERQIGNQEVAGLTPAGLATFMEICSWNTFCSHSFPSADSRRAVISFWRVLTWPLNANPTPPGNLTRYNTAVLIFRCQPWWLTWTPVGLKIRRLRQHSFMKIDHEIFFIVILSLPLIQEGQLSVSGKRMCTLLVNRLGD